MPLRPAAVTRKRQREAGVVIAGGCCWWNGYGGNLMKSRSNDEEIPSRSFATVTCNTFARLLFNLFIYESISNSFDYILFEPRVSIFAIKNGNTLHFTWSWNVSPGYFLAILNGVWCYITPLCRSSTSPLISIYRRSWKSSCVRIFALSTYICVQTCHV